ncbi:MAG: AbrB/MazE/SpoVT family DNA-binding domain-containing protein [Candidatus Woesearchaeota archaeon]|nr:AbrB/MazE/SpoVT family DNA-binding domain-containing protein [Candidatus Woesearchaeota archaeon]
MQVELTRISEKGQVVIPSSLRREMGIQKADQFMIFGEGGTVILKKIETSVIKKTFDEVAKPLQEAAKQAGLTKTDIQKAIKDVRAENSS